MKKRKSVTASGLKSITFKPLDAADDTPTMEMILTDIRNRRGAYIISPEGLRDLLLHCLGLAAGWWPDTETTGTARSPGNLLPAMEATAVSIGDGRTAGEACVEIEIGRCRLTFLVPRDHVTRAPTRPAH